MAMNRQEAGGNNLQKSLPVNRNAFKQLSLPAAEGTYSNLRHANLICCHLSGCFWCSWCCSWRDMSHENAVPRCDKLGCLTSQQLQLTSVKVGTMRRIYEGIRRCKDEGEAVCVRGWGKAYQDLEAPSGTALGGNASQSGLHRNLKRYI